MQIALQVGMGSTKGEGSHHVSQWMPSMPALAASVVPTKAGSSGAISAKWVGWRHRLAAKEAKALRCPRSMAVMRILLFLARFRASWRALKSPADPFDGGGDKPEFSKNSLEFLVGDPAGVGQVCEDLGQLELAVGRELDGLSDCVDDPTQCDLAS